MNCPNCNTSSFALKEYETVQIDQCKTCYGIWLDHNELNAIVKNLVAEFNDSDIKNTISNAFMGLPKNEKSKNRTCPKCNDKLNAVNYSVDSGVIIDRCPSGHGVWLDHFELDQVQQYREYWQENTKKSLNHFSNLVKEVNESSGKDSASSLIYDISMKIGCKLFKK